MGTPDFAAKSLEALIENKYDVAAVFTKADKPVGRGMKTEFSPVKKLALENGIEVFQPVKLRDEAIYDTIRGIAPDIIIVVAYGKIIPPEILEIPKYGCINVHGSLLPKYRGAAPIQWSVINGDRRLQTPIARSLQTWDRRVRPSLGLRHGTPLPSRGVPGERGHLSRCIWNLGFFSGRYTGESLPLRVDFIPNNQDPDQETEETGPG